MTLRTSQSEGKGKKKKGGNSFGRMFRAIEVRTDLNGRKKKLIKDLIKSYRKTALKIANYQWGLFFQTGSFDRKANIKHVQSNLSERYKYTIQYHLVVPALESFISNTQNRFKKEEYDITLEKRLLAKKIFRHILKIWKKVQKRKPYR